MALGALVRGRLLVAREAEGETVYEVAHEALVVGWGTLREWLDADVEQRAQRERVEAAAGEWERLGRTPDALWNERHLAEVAEVGLEPEELGPREAFFLKESRRHTRRQRRVRRGLLLGLAVVLGLVVLEAGRRERGAREQAALAQRLGQEIKDMEWVLRSARQLPLHDLTPEKGIVRRRMAQLQAELAGYGERGRGLAHYAIGRGYMALHEYPQALEHLQKAIEAGHGSAEVHYALGLVLGKHYEQAMSEARLSGGGEWAKKQLKEIEPRYLRPAIESLQRSRAMRHDAPAWRG